MDWARVVKRLKDLAEGAALNAADYRKNGVVADVLFCLANALEAGIPPGTKH
jgi:hypothetical protein